MKPIIWTGSRLHVLTGGLALGLACFSTAPSLAQDPPYTYQAVLEANGAPASGLYSARFRLWDASSNGMPISPADVVAGPTPPDPFGRLNLVPRGDPWSFWRDLLCRVAQPWPPVPFGDWPTAWDPIYLEVGVKGPGEPSFTTLSPRQELTPAPLAINAVLAGRADSLKLPFSASVSTALPAVQITQNGDGPAALFKVQPQPEPPLPMPAIEAISAISSPAMRASNTGSGSAIEAVSGQVGPPEAPTILATNGGSGPAGLFRTTNAASSGWALSVESNGTSYAAYVASTGSGHGLYATSTNGTPGSFEITNPANGSPALHAETSGGGAAVFAPNTGSGPGLYASSASGNAVHGISTSGNAGYFEGNVHVTGNLTKAYTTGTSNRAAPIAYAYISASGGVASGTPNVSSQWDSANSRYVITITGESYAVPGYMTVVTPRSATGAPLLATNNSSTPSGALFVRIFSLSGSPIQNDFQFVTYKP